MRLSKCHFTTYLTKVLPLFVDQWHYVWDAGTVPLTSCVLLGCWAFLQLYCKNKVPRMLDTSLWCNPCERKKTSRPHDVVDNSILWLGYFILCRSVATRFARAWCWCTPAWTLLPAGSLKETSWFSTIPPPSAPSTRPWVRTCTCTCVCMVYIVRAWLQLEYTK